ncbi:DUF4978 domain-containing protein [Bifidobacterium saguinibicoloris]|uniref:DUF4978 domain-containing protein n=1 Tax=Bifidobacterium saguinibicoloris TaxID=2834433 RepID=UPI001C591DA0|nr:DUF4978 domain-containing protein [Bifidobacterium saguinibicoloris]MBW3081166.1 DUF4978 domain-containing protein [Bifidobacterium saguinibicoloris]
MSQTTHHPWRTALHAVIAVIAAAAMVAPAGAVAAEDGGHAQDNRRVVSRVARKSNGEYYLEVNGRPYLYSFAQNMGTWERMGHQEEFKEDSGSSRDGYPTEHLDLGFSENAYEKTANLNYATISQALLWRDVETAPGVYDFTVLDAYVKWARKYGLKIDLAWFGSACQSGSRIPTYSSAWNGKEHKTVDIGYQYTAPSWYVQDEDGNPIGDYYDITGGKGKVDYPLITTGPKAEAMKQAEIKTMEAIFAHLAQTDPAGTVISIQLENEANNNPHFKDQYINWINDLGKAVKESDYSIATRVNYSGSGYPVNVNDYAYIDFAGPDPYSTSVSRMKEIIADGKRNSTLGHIAENSGDYANLTSLETTAFAAGGGYGTWEIDNWFCDGGGGHFNGPHALYSNLDQSDIHSQEMYYDWKLGEMPTMTEQAKELQRYNPGLNAMGQVLAGATASDRTGFNIDQDDPQTEYSAMKTIGRYRLGFHTTDGAVGIAATAGRNLYATSDTAGSVTITTEQRPDAASVGAFGDDGEWTAAEQRAVAAQDDGTYAITLKTGEALRLAMPVGDVLSNLALDATAEHSSVNADYPASNVNDGDEWSGTKSRNDPTYPQYVTLTWDKPQTFDTVDLAGIYAKDQNPTNWDIEVSANGKDGWTPVASSGDVTWSTSDGTAEHHTVTMPMQRDVTAMRIRINKAATTWGAYYITEITVTNTLQPLTELVADIDSSGPKETDYTAETWQPFAQALSAARTMLKQSEPDGKAVDETKRTLESAWRALTKEERPVDPDPSEPDRPNTPDDQDKTDRPNWPAEHGNDGDDESIDAATGRKRLSDTGSAVALIAVAATVTALAGIGIAIVGRGYGDRG